MLPGQRSKIKKVAKGLSKASNSHKKQSKVLKSMLKNNNGKKVNS
jgi:hypothetical protein